MWPKRTDEASRIGDARVLGESFSSFQSTAGTGGGEPGRGSGGDRRDDNGKPESDKTSTATALQGTGGYKNWGRRAARRGGLIETNGRPWDRAQRPNLAELQMAGMISED